MKGWLLDCKKGDEVYLVYGDRRYQNYNGQFVISKVTKTYIYMLQKDFEQVRAKVSTYVAGDRSVPHTYTSMGSGYYVYKSKDHFDEIVLLKSMLKNIEVKIQDLGVDGISLEQANRILTILNEGE